MMGNGPVDRDGRQAPAGQRLTFVRPAAVRPAFNPRAAETAFLAERLGRAELARKRPNCPGPGQTVPRSGGAGLNAISSLGPARPAPGWAWARCAAGIRSNAPPPPSPSGLPHNRVGVQGRSGVGQKVGRAGGILPGRTGWRLTPDGWCLALIPPAAYDCHLFGFGRGNHGRQRRIIRRRLCRQTPLMQRTTSATPRRLSRKRGSPTAPEGKTKPRLPVARRRRRPIQTRIITERTTDPAAQLRPAGHERQDIDHGPTSHIRNLASYPIDAGKPCPVAASCITTGKNYKDSAGGARGTRRWTSSAGRAEGGITIQSAATTCPGRTGRAWIKLNLIDTPARGSTIEVEERCRVL